MMSAEYPLFVGIRIPCTPVNRHQATPTRRRTNQVTTTRPLERAALAVGVVKYCPVIETSIY